jgi:hypothetical protein
MASWSVDLDTPDNNAFIGADLTKLWTDPSGWTSVSVDPGKQNLYLVHFRELATVSVEFANRYIRVWPAFSDLPLETIQHLIADQVVPRIIAHEGRLVIHAGAVQFDERAITIIGESGRGKSTLVASLDANGWPLLGDDVIIVTVKDDLCTGTAVYPSLRLFSDSIASLFPVSPVLSAVAHYTEKHRISIPLEADHEYRPATLAAMFFLRPEPSDNRISLRQMTPAESCMGVITNSFSLDPTGQDQARQKLAAASAFAATVPAFEIAYPRDYLILPDVHAVLRDQVTKLPRFPVGLEPRDQPVPLAQP